MTSNIPLEGGVDMHSHVGPSKFDRRVNGYEYARQCAVAGFDAIVMKEHYLPTVYAVEYIDRLLEAEGIDIKVVGSLVLNYCNGGFNPFAVQTAIDYGSKVIWAPTIDAKNHGEKTSGVGTFLGVEEIPEEYRSVAGLTATDEVGELTDDVRLCIEKIVDANVVLAIGHLSYEETEAMVEYATSLGHEKVVIDHPLFDITDFDRDQMDALVAMGATLNFPYCGLGPRFRWSTPEEICDNIQRVGVDNCIVSSDVGQPGNPSAPEALEMMGELLIRAGLSVEEYTTLLEHNPKELLDIA